MTDSNPPPVRRVLRASIEATPLLIENDGALLKRTDYWDGPLARHGIIFLTWNAFCGRILLPDGQLHLLAEMGTAREVIVSRGFWTEHNERNAIEVMFEDDSDAPFALHFGRNQTDRVLPDSDQQVRITMAAYTRAGKQKEWHARFLVVTTLPYLLPWYPED